MLRKFFWPVIDDLWSAKKACNGASQVLFLVGIVTGFFTFMQSTKVATFSDFMGCSYFDSAIFLVVGFFIYRCSRIASIAGLIAYITGHALIMPQMHHFSVMPLLFISFLIGGVRGSFAYHELKKGLSAEEIKTTLKEQKEATEPIISLKKRIIAWIILILLICGGFWLYKQSSGSSQSANSHIVIEDSVQKKNTASLKKSLPEKSEIKKQTVPSKPLPGEQVFKMKDGRTITGRVVGDDPVYYTVETSDGRQEIIIKEDIAP